MTAAEFEQAYKVKPFQGVPKTAVKSAGLFQGFGQRALGVIKDAGSNIQEAIAGQEEFTGQSPIRRGFEATAEAFTAPVKVGFEALPEPARKGLSKAGEVVGAGFKALTDTIGDSPALQKWVMEHPDAANALEEVAGTAAAAGKIAGDILVINQGAKAIQAGANTAAKAVKYAGKGISKAGEEVYKSAYTPTADEARLIQSNQAKVKFLKQELAKTPKNTPEFNNLAKQLDDAVKSKPVISSDTGLRRGVAGTEKQIGVQSNVEKLDLWKNKIEPALKGSKDTISKQELFAKAEQTVANEVEPARRAAMQNALDSLKADYSKFDKIDLATANQIKSSLDKFTPTKIFKGQDVASELKTLKADMADAIREKTYASLADEGIKMSYRDYANLKQLEKVGIKALTEAGKKGGFGNFWTTLYEQSTTPVKTIGGKVLYRVGNKLEFIGDKGVETLGQHLENIGAVATLKSSLASSDKQAGFIKNPMASTPSTNPTAPMQGSTEQIIESAGGWKPGMRQVFDTALLRGDKAEVIKLLPQVPAAYKATFAQKIIDILSK